MGNASTAKIQTINKTFLKTIYAVCFLLCGTAFILLSIISHMTKWPEFVSELFSHLGVGFLILSIIGIVVDFKHWRDYFEDRLSQIVIDKQYLAKLTREDLISLQTDVLKVYFKNHQIAGEEGFLKFYQAHIQAYIASPYRLNVSSYYQIDYLKSNNQYYTVTEVLAYTCKMNGGTIQSDINWSPDLDEYKESISFKIELTHSSFGKKIYEKESLRERGFLLPNELGFTIPLTDFTSCDNLNVIIQSKYTMRADRFIGWRMSYPTKGLTLTLQFPRDLKISYEYFFTETGKYRTTDDQLGYFNLTMDDWIMPDEGICLQLLKRLE
jgi:hypothetical protein